MPNGKTCIGGLYKYLLMCGVYMAECKMIAWIGSGGDFLDCGKRANRLGDFMQYTVEYILLALCGVPVIEHMFLYRCHGVGLGGSNMAYTRMI